MNIVALDLSLTSTGVAHGGHTCRIATKASDRLETRLSHIVDTLAEVVAADEAVGAHPDLFVVEDLPKNARAAGMTGPVHGAVRLWLHKRGELIVTVPAASVKKYATGKGNCDKTEMALAAFKRANLDFGRREDECDAWWLWAMAMDAYGSPVVDVPASHREAAEKVAWPTLADADARRQTKGAVA